VGEGTAARVGRLIEQSLTEAGRGPR
jgi:hypothetical protein